MRRASARSDGMTQIGMEDSSTERTQRIYARVAGFLYLWLIITGLARFTHYLPYRWVWDVRRNSEESRSVGTLISGRALQ
jgi:hypothetical protein